MAGTWARPHPAPRGGSTDPEAPPNGHRGPRSLDGPGPPWPSPLQAWLAEGAWAAPTHCGLPSPPARRSRELPGRGGRACAAHAGDPAGEGRGLREEGRATPGAEGSGETARQSPAISTLGPGSLSGPAARAGHSLVHGGGGRQSRGDKEEAELSAPGPVR